MSHFSPQSSLTYTGPSFNTSSLYDSAALTPNTLSELSCRRCLPMRNEETPLGEEAEAKHQCKQWSVLALLQNLSQKVKWHIHPMLRLQRKIKCTTNKGYSVLQLQLPDLRHPQLQSEGDSYLSSSLKINFRSLRSRSTSPPSWQCATAEAIW